MAERNKYSHRMGSVLIKISGKDGKPLANSEVTIRQKKHAFLFGCAEFSVVPLANGELDGPAEEAASERFDKFFDLFNLAVLPFYWGRFEPEKGKPDTVRMKKTAEWLASKGMTLKGHPLCWHTVCAPWLLDMTNAEIFDAQMGRIRRDVSEFAGLVDMWDVINEAVIMPIFNKYDNGVTRICRELGRIRLIREVFRAARESNPAAKLLINDFNTSESYDILIEGLLESGIKIDAIGIQSHMHQGYWGIEKTMEILERFSRFGLPIHFTETTLVSGHIMPPEIEDLNDYKVAEWPSTPEGEERQALEAATHYRTLFAHPLVESVTYWNFIDGGWLGAPAGFMTRENRVKPIYGELYKLIRNEWWTGPAVYVTDDEGSVRVSGYLGEYELICGDRTANFPIGRNDDPASVFISFGDQA